MSPPRPGARPVAEASSGAPGAGLWEERLWIDGPRGKLEAVLSRADGARDDSGVLLACPHPRFGGDLSNNVVAALASFLAGCGFPALRFNYHGVGRSAHAEQGSMQRLLYWAGISELDARERALEDLQAARAVLSGLVGGVHAVGYSLGAILSLQLAARGLCRSVAAIALPTDAHPVSDIELVTQPVLALQAPLDFASRREDVELQLRRMKGPWRIQPIAGADHFFLGLETAVAAFVAEFIAGVDRTPGLHRLPGL
jgi:alpha/beta superfamily hydrolase